MPGKACICGPQAGAENREDTRCAPQHHTHHMDRTECVEACIPGMKMVACNCKSVALPTRCLEALQRSLIRALPFLVDTRGGLLCLFGGAESQKGYCVHFRLAAI